MKGATIYQVHVSMGGETEFHPTLAGAIKSANWWADRISTFAEPVTIDRCLTISGAPKAIMCALGNREAWCAESEEIRSIPGRYHIEEEG